MESQAIIEFGKPLQRIEAPAPVPTGTQVLVRVERCGVCHSDVHIHDGYFDLGDGAKLPMSHLPLPHTLGHEVAGEVIALGPEARGASIGDHRVIYPWIGCGSCAACLRGEENFCHNARHLGVAAGAGGGYATHMLVPHPRYLIDYGDTPPALASIYMCSGLTAYSAMLKVGALGPRDDVLVLGAGGVGMMGIQFAKHLFGKAPLAVDIDEAKLQAAEAAGAKATYDAKDPEAIRKLMADTDGGVFGVVDFVGSEASFAFATRAVRRGGRVVIVGLFGGRMSMSIPLLPMRGLTIAGSYVGTLAEAEAVMALVRDGRIDPIPVREAPLAAANEVLTELKAGKVIGRVVLAP